MQEDLIKKEVGAISFSGDFKKSPWFVILLATLALSVFNAYTYLSPRFQIFLNADLTSGADGNYATRDLGTDTLVFPVTTQDLTGGPYVVRAGSLAFVDTIIRARIKEKTDKGFVVEVKTIDGSLLIPDAQGQDGTKFIRLEPLIVLVSEQTQFPFKSHSAMQEGESIVVASQDKIELGEEVRASFVYNIIPGIQVVH